MLSLFVSASDRIVRECKKAFEDVVEDFHSLDCIKARFEVWRRDYVAVLQGGLHWPVSPQTLQPTGAPATHHLEPPRGQEVLRNLNINVQTYNAVLVHSLLAPVAAVGSLTPNPGSLDASSTS